MHCRRFTLWLLPRRRMVHATATTLLTSTIRVFVRHFLLSFLAFDRLHPARQLRRIASVCGACFSISSLLLEHSTCAICHDCVCGGWNQSSWNTLPSSHRPFSCLASQLFVHESENHWWLGVLSISCSFYQHSYQDVSRNLSVVKSMRKLPFSRRPKMREFS